MARNGAFSRLVKEFGNEENQEKEHVEDEIKKVHEEEVEKKEHEVPPKKVAQKLMQGRLLPLLIDVSSSRCCSRH